VITQSNYFGGTYQVPSFTQEQYEQFKHQYVFDALKGLRYGEAFCQHFGIPNGTPLYYFQDFKLCEEWITNNYLRKNEA
jgi:hypothetical protein